MFSDWTNWQFSWSQHYPCSQGAGMEEGPGGASLFPSIPTAGGKVWPGYKVMTELEEDLMVVFNVQNICLKRETQWPQPSHWMWSFVLVKICTMHLPMNARLGFRIIWVGNNAVRVHCPFREMMKTSRTFSQPIWEEQTWGVCSTRCLKIETITSKVERADLAGQVILKLPWEI